MDISFDDARARVAAGCAAFYASNGVEVNVTAEGAEDADFWHVYVRAADPADEPLDAPMWLVSKRTGIVEPVQYVGNFARFDAMTPTASAVQPFTGLGAAFRRLGWTRDA